MSKPQINMNWQIKGNYENENILCLSARDMMGNRVSFKHKKKKRMTEASILGTKTVFSPKD